MYSYGMLRPCIHRSKYSQSAQFRTHTQSFRWIEGLRDCAQAAHHLPKTRVVCTMDREADFLDLFVERREHAPQVELLVRAKANRVLGKDTTAEGDKVVHRLFDEVRNAPARGACTVEVKRLSARVKASKQAPKNKRPARLAETTLRYEPVALPCPQATPVKLWMVHAREEHPPAKTEALEWFVLTTVPVTSADDATRILQWYALRWRIEDYFRILESGCKVEELQHHSAERLERAIAIKMVVSWRIQLMVRLGREVPELPAELLFSDVELRVLATFARSRNLDPWLHIHVVIGTMVQGEGGKWRTMANEKLHGTKMLTRATYRSGFSRGLARLGYEIEKSHADGRFEIAGTGRAKEAAKTREAKTVDRDLRL